MKERLKILGLIAPIVFLLDRLSKWGVMQKIPEGGSRTLVANFFDLVHTRNPGAAFGTFATLPEATRLPFFYLTSGIAVAVLLWYFFRLEGTRRLPVAALALILGGAVGNICDRILYGEVIDFLSLHWYHRWVRWDWGPINWRFKLEWPAFNVADSAITIGIVLFLLLMRKKTASR